MTPTEMESTLSEWSAAGIKGVKTDFLDDDSQQLTQWMDKYTKLCIKYKLMINWHGCPIPCGQRRRWPNMVSSEAVQGAEYYKVNAGPSLFHRLCLPYTRNAVGPMDFTGVTFGVDAAAKRDNSDAAELAISILYETGQQYWGDRPENYRARPAAMDLLKRVPVAWDETKFVDGYPGELVVLARRKGQDWYIAGMQNGDQRDLSVSLSFLTPGSNYDLTLYKDGSATSEIITYRQQSLLSTDKLQIHLLRNGGFCGVLTDRSSAAVVPAAPSRLGNNFFHVIRQADGKWRFTFPPNTKFENSALYDVSGRLIYNGPFRNNTIITLPSKGMYFLKTGKILTSLYAAMFNSGSMRE
jgi:hypothetical protein